MNNNNNDNDSFELIKEKELTEHLEGVNREYSQKINSLESSLECIVRQTDGYNSEITQLQEHNKYLYEASNEWHHKYEDTKILLSTAGEEIINLKIELNTLQSLHNDKVNNSETDPENSNQQRANEECFDVEITNTLKQYMEENKVLKQENCKYLNQIEEIHNKYIQTTAKHGELNNIKLGLQNEITLLISRINELDNINHEYLLEMKRLQNDNVDLQKNLSEIRNSSDDLHNSDARTIQMLYTPELAKTKRKCPRSSSPYLSHEIYSLACNNLIVDKVYNDKIEVLINKNEELISIESELANERKQNEELKEQLTKLINDYNFMENEQNIKMQECHKQIGMLTNQNKQLTDEKNECKTKHEQLTEKINKFVGNEEKQKKENEQLLNDKNKLKKEKKENDELLKKQKNTFIELTETLKTQMKQLNEYKLNKLNQIKKLDSLQIELEKQRNKNENDKNEYHQQVTQNSEREKILKKKNQQLIAEKHKFDALFESIKKELGKGKKQNEELLKKYKVKESDNTQLRGNAKLIENELEKENKEINYKLQAYKMKNNQLTEKLICASKHKITIKQLDEKVALLTNQNVELTQNCESVKNLLANEKKRFVELVRSYNKSETERKLGKARQQCMPMAIVNDDSDEKIHTLRYTYGMNVYYTKEYAKKQGISRDYIRKNTTNDGMVKDCFHVIVRKNDKIAFDDCKVLQAPRVPGAKTSLIKVLLSDMVNPKIASHGKLLASIEVEFNAVDDHEQIMTEWIFSGTMFKIYSYPKSDPKKKKELPITYEL